MSPRSVAWFISPHGFGHAARAAAIATTMRKKHPQLELHLFTSVPRWFFERSGCEPFSQYHVMNDVGLVQLSPTIEDVDATVERLHSLLPFREELIMELCTSLKKARCDLVVCDISPLGIVVARRLGIPSVLIENFCWDWIYSGYIEQNEKMKLYSDLFGEHFSNADYRIQTEPVCHRVNADLVTPPISRSPKMTGDELREKLRLPEKMPVVTITMGGVSTEYPFLNILKAHDEVAFLIGGSSSELKNEGNIYSFSGNSDIYHPDLIRMSNVVIGKVGYSTLSEVYHAGVPFGYIPRQHFKESAVLVNFVANEMQGIQIAEEEFASGRWLDKLPNLLSGEVVPPQVQNGADIAAKFLLSLD